MSFANQKQSIHTPEERDEIRLMIYELIANYEADILEIGYSDAIELKEEVLKELYNILAEMH
jgi:hypothetical protein